MEGLFQAARSRGGGDRASRRRRDLAFLAACALTFVAGAATLAQAQTGLGDAYDIACQEAGAKSSASDTFPQRCANEAVAGPRKERGHWTQIAGAEYPEDEPFDASSPTPVTVDLYSVAARNARQVFAGGAACAAGTSASELESCPRVPVIYATDETSPWHEDYRDPDGRPGYVGAIAWIGRGRALAVGGTGTYPEREPPPSSGKPYADMTPAERLAHDKAHGAGDARAWYFHDGSWEEISSQLPEEMGGLSALDVWIGREDDGDEWGLAGDYGHVWEWEGGRFTGSHIDRDAPSIGDSDPEWSVVEGPLAWTPPSDAANTTGQWQPSGSETSSSDFFGYRVREIRIAPDRTQKRAFAFTAGCCGPAADGASRRIEFVPKPRKDKAGVAPPEAPAPGRRPRWIVSSTNTYGDSVYSFALDADRHFNTGADPFGEPQPPHDSLTWRVDPQQGLVRSPGGPESTDTGGQDPTKPPEPRYVDSDGDTEQSGQSGRPVPGNGIPDWKVGEAPPSEPDVRGLGVLATTVNDLKAEYGALRPYCNPAPATNANAGFWIGVDEAHLNAAPTFAFPPNPEGSIDSVYICRAQQIQSGVQPQLDSDGPARTRESGIQLGPSWALNSVEMLDAENVGYAVGDRGAIMRFGTPPIESDPPSLGSRRPHQLTDVSPYDEARPQPSARAGEVPALAQQPIDSLEDPRLVRAGSPDGNEIGSQRPAEDAGTIVMSRDGSEGWAVGPSQEARPNNRGGLMTLYHYSGGQWTRCDPLGIPGIAPPDAACAELADLYRHQDAAGTSRIRLDVAARVPFEFDSNPSNDDEFEVIAVGTPLETVPDGFATRPIPTVLHYRDGRWRLDEFDSRNSLRLHNMGMSASSLACVGPNECWLAGSLPGESNSRVLYRFDGARWVECMRPGGQGTDTPVANPKECGDLAARVANFNFSATGRTPLNVAAAGERVYVAGSRAGAASATGISSESLPGGAGPPMILYKQAGPAEQWQADGGGFDPGATDSNPPGGIITSVSVARHGDGSYEGWAVGAFDIPIAGARELAKWPLLHLDPDTGDWSPWTVKDASYDLFGPSAFPGTSPSRLVTLPSPDSGSGLAYLATRLGAVEPGLPSHLLVFNPARGRWEMAEKPAVASVGIGLARATALTPDSRGGIWAAFGTGGETDLQAGVSETYFYNYTRTPRREVFSEVASPFGARERLTDLSATPDGSIWAATDAGALHRYDRATGWERATVPGWDPGRVVTRRSAVQAVAVSPSGEGLAVGERGRVAELSPDRVQLDPAAGTVCDAASPQPPCGTGFDLLAADVASDGSGIVGGEKLALLWRPPGGAFRRITGPDAPPTATITGIAMPTPGRAWLALDSGQVFAGSGDESGNWSWRLESSIDVGGQDRLLTEDPRGEPIPLRAIAIDPAGSGLAVGDRGLVLERSDSAQDPWRRVDVGVTERLASVALPSSGGSGALIGGDRGLILTQTSGEWRVARAGDQLRPDNGLVSGVALLPGYEDGQLEAWAAVSPPRDANDVRQGMNQLLHYTNAPSEPLLSPEHGSDPLPDVPAPREGELSFAAFGRSDCNIADDTNLFPCPPLENGTDPEQAILRRVRDEVLARSREPGGPQFSIFTGDAYETGGPGALEPVEQNSRAAGTEGAMATEAATFPAWTGGEKYRRFTEQVPDWLADRQLPVFSPIGARDLSETRQCAIVPGVTIQCAENRDRARVGENLAWRQAMESAPAPWGAGEPAATRDGLVFEPLAVDGLTVQTEDDEVDDPSDEVPATDDPSDEIPETEVEPIEPGIAPTLEKNINDRLPDRVGGREEIGDTRGEEMVEDRPVPLAGASTHYAADIVSPAGEVVARLVVVDTSVGSLTGSDPIQNPLEADGQRGWLERVLCIEGGPFDTGDCTRPPDQQAIVVSNTPTYSYGPTDPTQTMADAAVFESILLRHRANVVVSGKLGWNGRYWATAPGLHEPCPGEDYVPDSQTPEAGPRVCGQGPAGVPDAGQAATEAQGSAAEALSGTGGQGVLPFVVASNAGGRFDELAEQSGATASDGLWRGYSIVRLDPSGDPAKTIVEQRPVFDWIGIRANDRVLAARKRLRLEGVGREPITAKSAGDTGGGRYDEIDSAAITHRYDLVLADPEQPWRPCSEFDSGCLKLRAGLAEGAAAVTEGENPCAPYICLPDRIGTIDPQTGEVKAGDGRYPDVFAVALLSVDDKVATYPLVFKRSPSFVVKSQLRLPGAPPTTNAPTPKPPGQPPLPDVPQIPKIEIPAPPAPPAIPSLTAAAPPELQPPAPPAPPPPAQQPTPLDLTVAPPGVSISTPTALIQPPTPPVNPAPPGGARREARQRQAAAQKGGADSSEEASDSQVDMVDNPNATHGASNMTRHEGAAQRNAATARRRSRDFGASFTTLARAEGRSTWSQGALYGAGLTLAAAILVAGFSTLRPTPRRRQPELPAPAHSTARRRG